MGIRSSNNGEFKIAVSIDDTCYHYEYNELNNANFIKLIVIIEEHTKRIPHQETHSPGLISLIFWEDTKYNKSNLCNSLRTLQENTSHPLFDMDATEADFDEIQIDALI